MTDMASGFAHAVSTASPQQSSRNLTDLKMTSKIRGKLNILSKKTFKFDGDRFESEFGHNLTIGTSQMTHENHAFGTTIEHLKC